MKKLFLLIFVSVIMTIPISIVCADSGYHSPSAVISEMGESYQIIEEKIQIASETEPLYTYEEILSIPDDHFPNASVEEVALIKKMITDVLSTGASNREIPLSMVYIDRSEENSDAILSGGGLPYCLDDNGWGPANFITSDCDRAMLVVKQCIYESIIKKPEWRYCRAELWRNCSPRIGHKPTWHRH